jgi:hypothetical protein
LSAHELERQNYFTRGLEFGRVAYKLFRKFVVEQDKISLIHEKDSLSHYNDEKIDMNNL